MPRVSPRTRTTGVVLTGGAGRRLGGQDKALIQLAGEPLLARTLRTLQDVTETQLVVGHPDRHAGFGATVVSDQRTGAGPLAGLETALLHAATPRVLLVACDLPFLPARLLRALLDAAPEAEVVLPVSRGFDEPLCARYATGVLPRVSEALDAGLRKMTAFFQAARVTRVPLSSVPDVQPADLLNCNTPEALAEARRRLSPHPTPKDTP